jgi:hypothetical protein
LVVGLKRRRAYINSDKTGVVAAKFAQQRLAARDYLLWCSSPGCALCRGTARPPAEM